MVVGYPYYNSQAATRANEFNAVWVPAVYTDGGHQVAIGWASYGMRLAIESSSGRLVAPLNLIVRLDHLGDDVYEIAVRVRNDAPVNLPPAAPAMATGPDAGNAGAEMLFEAAATDPDEDPLYYQWDWGDGDSTGEWTGPIPSGETCTAGHVFAAGDYELRVRAKDAWGIETEWSAIHSIQILYCCRVRGNVDDDAIGGIDIADLVYLVDYMFSQGPPPPCPEAANIDADAAGTVDVSDLVYLVDYMISGGPPPTDCIQ